MELQSSTGNDYWKEMTLASRHLKVTTIINQSWALHDFSSTHCGTSEELLSKWHHSLSEHSAIHAPSVKNIIKISLHSSRAPPTIYMSRWYHLVPIPLMTSGWCLRCKWPDHSVIWAPTFISAVKNSTNIHLLDIASRCGYLGCWWKSGAARRAARGSRGHPGARTPVITGVRREGLDVQVSCNLDLMTTTPERSKRTGSQGMR